MIAIMWAAAIAVCFFVVACNHYEGFPCTDSSQCTKGTVAGTCEGAGYCSFPDETCDSGRKFEPNAPNGLGGTCVALCGRDGQACCDGEVSCTGNSFCQTGTCAKCVLDVALGRRFICAVKYDGTVWCSGANESGQLGNGATSASPRSTPSQVRDAGGMPLTDVVDVGAGYDFACAVKNDRTVWCWGVNTSGQLGNGVTLMPPATTAPTPVPWAVQVIGTNNQPLSGAAEVVAGYGQSCARMHAGGVQCWGYNVHGELGDNTTTSRSKAAAVSGLAGVAAIDYGSDHGCVRTSGNNILCWGRNESGQTFDGTTNDRLTPVMVANATSFTAGRTYTCIVGPDTSISCAGWNGHGRFGVGYGESYEDGDHTTPLQTVTEVGGPPFTGVAEVTGGGVTCARMIDKTAYCWGDGTYGGTGTGVGSTVPLPVRFADGKPLTDVESIKVKFQHACAITSGGDLLCWGRGLNGELGNGTFLNQGAPVPFSVGCP